MSASWFPYVNVSEAAAMRLFCLPPAGGAAVLFRTWSTSLPEWVEVRAVELPGHGTRWREPCLVDLPGLLESLTQAVQGLLDKPYAIFGHSLGALVGFELARSLRERTGRHPVVLSVSASRAPHLPNLDLPVSQLDEPQLLERVRELGGTPTAVLAEPELMRVLLPAIRCDFTLRDTYVFAAKPPLECAIAGFGGADDDTVSQCELDAWREHTRGPFSTELLPGGHFYLQTARVALLASLTRHLITRLTM